MIFSVIIPTAGRPRFVAELAGALRAQVFDQPFEILMVNDRCGKDRPGEDPRRLEFRAGQRELRVRCGSGAGPAAARNLGASEARGTYLLFLDDDSMVDKLYLARVWKELESHPGCAIAGMQVAIERSNSFSLAAEWLSHGFLQEEALTPPYSKFAATNGLALRRTDFERCGGFDEFFPLAASEDREFSVRWLASGFQFMILKEASVGHHFAHSFPVLMKQQWRYGRGAFHLRSKVAPGLGSRVRSPLFYVRMLTQAPLRYGFLRGLWIGTLSWLCQAAILAGYLAERIRPASKRPSAAPRTKEARAE